MKQCILIAALTVMVLAGCGGAEGPATTTTPTTTAPEKTVTPSEPPGEPTGSATPRGDAEPRTAEGQAVRDLARRLDVPEADITVVRVEQVTWRDRSLGCPRPGMMYAQVLTDGVRVVLEADGERYEYHAGGGRSAFLCEDPEPPAGN